MFQVSSPLSSIMERTAYIIMNRQRSLEGIFPADPEGTAFKRHRVLEDQQENDPHIEYEASDEQKMHKRSLHEGAAGANEEQLIRKGEQSLF